MPAARRARAKPAAKPAARRKTKPRDKSSRKPLGYELSGLGLMTLGILLLLATRLNGNLSESLLYAFQWTFGVYGAWGIAFAFIILGAALMVLQQRMGFSRVAPGMALIFLAALGMAQLTWPAPWTPAEFAASPGGMIGGAIAGGLAHLLGQLAWVVLVFFLLCGVTLMTEIPLWVIVLSPVKVVYLAGRWCVRRLRQRILQRRERRRAALVEALQEAERHNRFHLEPERLPVIPPRIKMPVEKVPAAKPMEEEEEETEPVVGVPSRKKPQQLEFDAMAPTAEGGRSYALPSLDLLDSPPRSAGGARDDSTEKILVLEEKLRSFGIEAKVVGVERGPRVTRFEILPPPGVRISKITNLADDIALSLSALDVRVEAPVPGKGVVGIEVPNKELTMVSVREIIDSEVMRKSKSPLAFTLGRDIAGHPRIADLTKMPHLLIAGATNSGKSVCINSLLCSILMRATPREVKLLLVDPKRVELSLFQHIPHLIAPVAYDAKHAAGLLRWAIREMEGRYEMFADKGVRNIIGFNEQSRLEVMEELPYIVIIIDELADLMMQAAAEFEASICRIAQLARATGIHLVVATQRPSVNVITGTIKANIPSRIAFSVASQVDSRTILDMNGAERLVGQGDMLYLPVDASKPARIQGAFVSEVEINHVVSFIKGQGKPLFSDEIVAIEEEAMRVEGDERYNDEPEDELFDRAIDYIRTTKYASTSMLQRKFRIGYTRAARLMDIFEERGFVGPGQGSKPREVIFAPAASVVGRPSMPEIPEDGGQEMDEE
jgi:S-DNA-T family DNA segregation ATPase FtsK/SpoIIIE